MIDNFNLIENILTFNVNSLYRIEIYKRRKDVGNENMLVGQKTIKSYVIKSLADLHKLTNKIQELCIEHNARAYIDVNRRSFEKIAKIANIKLGELIYSKNYHLIENLFNKSFGDKRTIDKKYWLIDVDDPTLVIEIKNKIESSTYNDNPTYYIPTVNGGHILVEPFNMMFLLTILNPYRLNSSDIKKNNPTLLFFAN